MRKVIVVAVREYLAAVKSKAFLITILLMPVLMGSGVIADKFLSGTTLDTRARRIAIVDHTGILYDELAAAAELHNAVEIYDPTTAPDKPKQIAPRFILERLTPTDNVDEMFLELSERVRNGELFAFVEIEPDVLDAPAAKPPSDSSPRAASVRYFSNAPTYRNVRHWLAGALATSIQQWRLDKSGLDPEKVDWAMQPTAVAELGLLTRDPATGAIVPAKEVDNIGSVVIPFLLVVLLFMVIMMAAGPLIQSVLEEKMQRIAEVLLGCIDPFGWMLGKLLGMVAVSFTIVGVYLGGGLVVAAQRGMLQFLPLHLLGWFVTYQVLAVLMYGAVFVGVGAACSDHREAQTMLTPLMMVLVVPMILLESVIREPNSALATALSLFPPVTPVVMLTRQAVPPGIPLWQPVLGVVLVLVTTVFCVFAAGRVFRIGILMEGRGARVRDLLRWVVTG